MAYWGDLLDNEDKINGDFKHETPLKADPVKLLAFKAKAAGGDASLNQGFDMVFNKDRSGHVFKSKSELKHACWKKQINSKITVTNKDKAWEFTYAPESLNENGVQTEFANEGNFAPSGTEEKNAYNASISAQTGGYELGPIRPWIRAQFNWNNKNERDLEQTANFVYEKDFHCAYKVNVDLVGKALTSAFGVLAVKNQEWGAAWLRTNCSQKFVALGWAGNAWGAKHVLEAQYNYSPKESIAQQGIAGVPFYVRYGNQWKLTSGSLSTVARLGQKADISAKFTTAVQPNVNVTIEERVNADSFVKGDAAGANYQWGIGVELKL